MSGNGALGAPKPPLVSLPRCRDTYPARSQEQNT